MEGKRYRCQDDEKEKKEKKIRELRKKGGTLADGRMGLKNEG